MSTKRPADVAVGDRIIQTGYGMGDDEMATLTLTVTDIATGLRGKPGRQETVWRFTFDGPALFRTYRADWDVELAP